MKPKALLVITLTLLMLSLAIGNCYAISPPEGGIWKSAEHVTFTSADEDLIDLSASTAGTYIFGGTLRKDKTTGASHTSYWNLTEADFIGQHMNTSAHVAYKLTYKFKVLSEDVTGVTVMFETASTEGYRLSFGSGGSYGLYLSYANLTLISNLATVDISDLYDFDYHYLEVMVTPTTIIYQFDKNETLTNTVADSLYRQDGVLTSMAIQHASDAGDPTTSVWDSVYFDYADTNPIVDYAPLIVEVGMAVAILGMLAVAIKKTGS